MAEIRIKKYVRYLFGLAFLVFVLNKLYLRPWVLKNELPYFFQVIVYSIPNFIEAIMGTTVITGLSFRILRWSGKKISDFHIYLFSTGIASIYVISQELKYHNIGGNNVYDPNDLIASILGLGMMLVFFQTFGFLEKKKIE
ncbi:hypothetical protein QQ008_15080 [Fulvivirgaceae bacterium BMA10]|uniref:VanZ-like domain-containing protein n=1 Tax=Splendidivirga corallicola TaxID=3051826 RepID=A0ABT8KPQ2_9BACT|nr:hypothetical protein [Fulvivirgaceae bacterium BMA10]